jgi:hypothetical protein
LRESRQIFINVSVSTAVDILPVGAALTLRGGGEVDRHDEDNRLFQQCGNAPKRSEIHEFRIFV